MTETATRRRNGTAPDHGGPSKPKSRPKAAATKRAASRGAAKAPTKAKTAAKPRGKPKTGQAAKQTAAKAKDAVAEHTPSAPKPGKVTRKLAWVGIKKLTKPLLGKALEAGAGMIRTAADKAAATGHEAVEKTAQKRLPIQRSVDIAVPIRVAWEEWMAFESIPEGVHNVTDIERDGAELTGRTSGPRPGNWAAEILDEREQQSFAWQSHQGSDCAGLITFHELSRRLTRIELNLDVVPTRLLDTFQLTAHTADRKAEAELRRFKARLELINPDLYEEDEDEEPADEPEAQGDEAFDEEDEDAGEPEEPDESDQQDEPDEQGQAA